MCWKIESIDANTFVAIQIVKYDTEDSWDKIRLYDSNYISATNAYETYSGRGSGEVWKRDTNTAIVRFTSDATWLSDSFIVRYSSYKPELPIPAIVGGSIGGFALFVVVIIIIIW